METLTTPRKHKPYYRPTTARTLDLLDLLGGWQPIYYLATLLDKSDDSMERNCWRLKKEGLVEIRTLTGRKEVRVL